MESDSTWETPHVYADKMIRELPIDLLVPYCEKLIKNNSYDTYVNKDSQPGWYQKITKVHPGKFNILDAFEPRTAMEELETHVGDEVISPEQMMDFYRSALIAYQPLDPLDNHDVQQACKEIEIIKNKYCEKDNSITCNKKLDSDETLRRKHNHFMACRNIRAIENTSHCRISTRGHYKFPHDVGHLQQVVQTGEAAGTCRDFYNENQGVPSFNKGSKKKRSIVNKSVLRKPPSNYNVYLPRRSSRK